jgi:hypothetical protein
VAPDPVRDDLQGRRGKGLRNGLVLDRAAPLRRLEQVVERAPVLLKHLADEARKWLRGIRVGGTHVPGLISAGTFHSRGQWVSWDVHDPEKAIGIHLRDERYGKLVIEVADPDDAVGRIRRATG